MEMAMGAPDQELNQIIRGKRTKRQRLLSPLPLAITSSSSSSGFTDNINTEEEEDMASCLILLAQGSHDHHNPKSSPESDAYQCKTCDRCFSSFQALGGHRASHKKPKAVNIEDKKVCMGINPSNETSTSLSLQTVKSKHKVHECSVCGAEFSSGQALGGHMRRHRTTVSGGGGGGGSGPSTTLSLDSAGSHEDSHHETKKPRNSNTNLNLDLNLPAAAEDDVDRDRKEVDFRFRSNEQVIVFSASPLIDCHY